MGGGSGWGEWKVNINWDTTHFMCVRAQSGSGKPRRQCEEQTSSQGLYTCSQKDGYCQGSEDYYGCIGGRTGPNLLASSHLEQRFKDETPSKTSSTTTLEGDAPVAVIVILAIVGTAIGSIGACVACWMCGCYGNKQSSVQPVQPAEVQPPVAVMQPPVTLLQSAVAVQPAKQTINVQVPVRVMAGQQLQVQGPNGMLSVTVPAGVGAGQTIQVPVPQAAVPGTVPVTSTVVVATPMGNTSE